MPFVRAADVSRAARVRAFFAIARAGSTIRSQQANLGPPHAAVASEMGADDRGSEGIWTADQPSNSQNPPADFEKAIAETGYGFFNVLLLLSALPIAWTCIIDTTSTAFIINSAECVFELTMLRRGIAVSIVYIGMIIAGPIWDFILQDCITGSIGKRNTMVFGMFLDAICNICWSHASSFCLFILFKFVSGILIAGPLSVVMAYLAEFHAPTYQQKFSRWAGLFVAVSNIIPAALAAILMLWTPWFNFTIRDHFYPTWRIYLLICAIPSVFGFWITCFMPKSPKFLMNRGQSDEALQLLRIMYSMNKFKPCKDYPITELVSRPKVRCKVNDACKDKLQDSISKLKTLFSKPHLKTLSIMLFIQFSSMVGFNVMRLWVPLLFVMLNNFRVLVRSYYPVDEFITMCEMLFPRIQKIDYTSCNYTLPTVESAVYVNSTIIATSAVGFGFVLSLIAVTRIKKILVISFAFLLSALGCFGANWAIEIPYMLILLALVIVTSRIAGNTILAYNTEIMPQLLRTTSAGLINFIGNFGAAVGCIVFSLIFGFDCLSAFFVIGSLTLVCTIVPLFLIKQEDESFKPKIERY